MSTERQILANKKNAKRSSGPTSQAGKIRSSFNALRHGLSSRTGVLPWEDQAEFDALRDNLKQEYQPRTTAETIEVEQLAICYWRLMRLRNIETAIYLYSRNEYEGDMTGPYARYMSGVGYTNRLEAELAKESVESHDETVKVKNANEIERLKELSQLGPAFSRSTTLLESLYRQEAKIEKTIRSLKEGLGHLKSQSAQNVSKGHAVKEPPDCPPPRHRERPPQLN